MGCFDVAQCGEHQTVEVREGESRAHGCGKRASAGVMFRRGLLATAQQLKYSGNNFGGKVLVVIKASGYRRLGRLKRHKAETRRSDSTNSASPVSFSTS